MENSEAEPFLLNLHGVLEGKMLKDTATCFIQLILLSPACSAIYGVPETIIEKVPLLFCSHITHLICVCPLQSLRSKSQRRRDYLLLAEHKLVGCRLTATEGCLQVSLRSP